VLGREGSVVFEGVDAVAMCKAMLVCSHVDAV